VGEELKGELETQDGSRPLGLGWVVSESLRSKGMLPLKDFLAAKESVYRRDWSELPWRIVEWGLEKAGLAGWGGEGKISGKYVVLGNVEVSGYLQSG
jgi:charged multivesicular body protein 7